jgi:hypothetical protein
LHKLRIFDKIILFFASGVLAFELLFIVLLPAQGYAGLQLIAVAEPYFQYAYYMRALQIFIVFGAKYLFFPFMALLSYLLTRWLLTKIAFAPFRFFFARALQKDNNSLLIRIPRRYLALTGPFETVLVKLTGALRATGNIIRKFTPGFIRRNCRRLFVASKVGLYVYLGIGTVLTAVELLFFLQLVFNVVSHPTGAIAFHNNCEQCHGFNRPFNFNHTKKVWEITVDRMYRHAPDMGKTLPPDKKEDIIELLLSIRSYSNKRLLRSKCYTCHSAGRIFEQTRSAAEWEELVDRKYRENTFYITIRQRDQLVEYFANEQKHLCRDLHPIWDYKRKLLFERKCSVCHTLDILLMPHIREADWPAILARMGTKEPDYLSVSESESLMPVIEKALSDQSFFFDNFPHSTMREKTYEKDAD